MKLNVRAIEYNLKRRCINNCFDTNMHKRDKRANKINKFRRISNEQIPQAY